MRISITACIVLLILVLVMARPHSVDAQNLQQQKGEHMAQKWEYKYYYFRRTAAMTTSNIGHATDWECLEDFSRRVGGIDMVAKSRELGEAGWELMEMTPRASDPRYPGFTTEEIWTFKRPKN